VGSTVTSILEAPTQFGTYCSSLADATARDAVCAQLRIL